MITRKLKAWWLRQVYRTSSGERISVNDSLEVVQFKEFLKEDKIAGRKKREETYAKIYE